MSVRPLALLGLLSLAWPGRLAAQSMELTTRQTKGTIGDRFIFEVTVHLRPGMELIDAVPHTLVPPPRGIRMLAADTLRQDGPGSFRGTATMAFYRIGPQPVPTLALLYRTEPGAPPDTLLASPDFRRGSAHPRAGESGTPRHQAIAAPGRPGMDPARGTLRGGGWRTLVAVPPQSARGDDRGTDTAAPRPV